MQKALFTNDLSGFVTSFPQLGHLTKMLHNPI